MKARCFPCAVFAAVTSLGWLALTVCSFAQPQVVSPNAAGVAEAVPLSSGAGEILKLSRAKVNDDVTVAFIRNGEGRFALTASEIVYLRQEGVSDRVLTAMLNQPPQAAPSPASPVPAPAAPPTEAFASAPQYVAPPTTTTVVETPPASTVHVVSAAPMYYYPYYDPWPYYWSPYWSPFVSSFGFYWAWGDWDCDDDYKHCDKDKHHDKSNGGNPHSNKGHPRSGDNVPPRTGNGEGNQRAFVQNARRGPEGSGRQSASNTGNGFSGAGNSRLTANARPTSFWSRETRQTEVAGASGTRSGSTPASATPAAGLTRQWSSGAVSRSGGAPATGNQAGGQIARNGNNGGRTGVWTGSSSRNTMAHNTAGQSSAFHARSAPMNAGANRIGGPGAAYPGTAPTANFSHSGTSSRVASFGGGSPAGISRSSIGYSHGSPGGSSAFRSGGHLGSSGGSARMASGGGSRGGGFRR